ncbi:unnamed protein product [Ectocarpus sp. 4 AP-2014]
MAGRWSETRRESAPVAFAGFFVEENTLEKHATGEVGLGFGIGSAYPLPVLFPLKLKNFSRTRSKCLLFLAGFYLCIYAVFSLLVWHESTSYCGTQLFPPT